MDRISISYTGRRDALRLFARERRRTAGHSSLLKSKKSRPNDGPQRKRSGIAKSTGTSRAGPEPLSSAVRSSCEGVPAESGRRFSYFFDSVIFCTFEKLTSSSQIVSSIFQSGFRSKTICETQGLV